MALQKSRTKFKQQQEKCLSTLSNITVRADHQELHHLLLHILIVGPFPNTERYQLIHNIKKSEPWVQVKRVIDFLRETREDFTAEQIKEACHVDAIENKVVFIRFSYKPTHDIKNRRQLLQLIRENSEGIAISELKDAYIGVSWKTCRL
ncbi:hypothetical protein MKX01_034461 [Papaver californicum]|nr:hypothetical protein MKX01_034461 [Papaver californicum]